MKSLIPSADGLGIYSITTFTSDFYAVVYTPMEDLAVGKLYGTVEGFYGSAQLLREFLDCDLAEEKLLSILWVMRLITRMGSQCHR